MIRFREDVCTDIYMEVCVCWERGKGEGRGGAELQKDKIRPMIYDYFRFITNKYTI